MCIQDLCRSIPNTFLCLSFDFRSFIHVFMIRHKSCIHMYKISRISPQSSPKAHPKHGPYLGLSFRPRRFGNHCADGLIDRNCHVMAREDGKEETPRKADDDSSRRKRAKYTQVAWYVCLSTSGFLLMYYHSLTW
jgi:hypothetical protein